MQNVMLQSLKAGWIEKKGHGADEYDSVFVALRLFKQIAGDDLDEFVVSRVDQAHEKQVSGHNVLHAWKKLDLSIKFQAHILYHILPHRASGRLSYSCCPRGNVRVQRHSRDVRRRNFSPSVKKFEASPSRKDYQDMMKRALEDGIQDANMATERYKAMTRQK